MTTSQVEKKNDVENPPEGCVSRVRLRDPQELPRKQKKKRLAEIARLTGGINT